MNTSISQVYKQQCSQNEVNAFKLLRRMLS